MGSEPAALILIRERHVIGSFRAAGATSPERAKRLAEVGLLETWAVLGLKGQEVLRQDEPGTYWLDLQQWNRVRRRKTLWLLWVDLAVLFLVGGFVLFWFLRR